MSSTPPVMPDGWVGKPYKPPRRRRPDADYEIEALSKGIKVLEALEGTAFEPVRWDRIAQRTGFTRDLVMRTLKTLRLNGYAVQNARKEWTVAARFLRFADSARRHKGDAPLKS